MDAALPAFEAGGVSKRHYCLCCAERLRSGRGAVRPIRIDRFADLPDAFDPRVVAVLKQHGDASVGKVHTACERELTAKALAARAAALSRPQTRAAKAATGPVPVLQHRSVPTAADKAVQLGPTLGVVPPSSRGGTGELQRPVTRLALGELSGNTSGMGPLLPPLGPLGPPLPPLGPPLGLLEGGEPGASPTAGSPPRGLPANPEEEAPGLEPASPPEQHLLGVSPNGEYFRARQVVCGRAFQLLSTRDRWQAALAINLFRAELRQLFTAPGSGLGVLLDNDVPPHVKLSFKQQLQVMKQVAAATALLAQSRAADAAAAAAKTSLVAERLTGALRALEDHSPTAPKKLLRLLDSLASGELPASSILTQYILHAPRNFVSLRRGKPSACRWPPMLIDVVALARAQQSAERAVDIISGERGDPNMPLPGRDTAIRAMRQRVPESAPFTGVSQARVTALAAEVAQAGLPPVLFAAMDGTDTRALLERVPHASGERLVGDEDMGGIGGPGLLPVLQQEQDSLKASLAAVDASGADGVAERQLMCVRAVASYAAWPFLARMEPQLQETEAAAKEEQARAVKKAAKRQRAAQAEAAAAGGDVQPAALPAELPSAAKAAALRETMLSASRFHERVGALPREVPQVSLDAATYYGNLAQLVQAARELVPELIDAQRQAANSFVAITLTSLDNSLSAVIGKLYVHGKMKEPAVRAALAAIDAAVHAAGATVAAHVTDGEHFAVTNDVGPLANNRLQLQRQVEAEAAAGPRARITAQWEEYWRLFQPIPCDPFCMQRGAPILPLIRAVRLQHVRGSTAPLLSPLIPLQPAKPPATKRSATTQPAKSQPPKKQRGKKQPAPHPLPTNAPAAKRPQRTKSKPARLLDADSDHDSDAEDGAAAEEQAPDADPDDIPCALCGSRECVNASAAGNSMEDVMLICGNEAGTTGCGRGFHVGCLGDSMDSLPPGDFLCPRCTAPPEEDPMGTAQAGALPEPEPLPPPPALPEPPVQLGPEVPPAPVRAPLGPEAPPLLVPPPGHEAPPELPAGVPTECRMPDVPLTPDLRGWHAYQRPLEYAAHGFQQQQVLQDHFDRMREIAELFPEQRMVDALEELLRALDAEPAAVERPATLDQVEPLELVELRSRLAAFLTAIGPAADSGSASNSSSAAAEAEWLVRRLPVAEGGQVVVRLIERLRGSSCPMFVTAEQMRRAYWQYRLTHGMKPSRLGAAQASSIAAGAVRQELMHAKQAEHRRGGRDFSQRHAFVPPGQAGVIMDEPHKLKTAAKPQVAGSIYAPDATLAYMQAVAARRRSCIARPAIAVLPAGAVAAAPTAQTLPPPKGGELCFDSRILVGVLTSVVEEVRGLTPSERRERFDGEDPKVLLAIATGRTDTQSVPCAQHLMGSKALHWELRRRGFHREAVAMRVLSNGFRAVDEAQLNPLVRQLMLEERYYFLNRILGNSWGVVGGSSGHVCGLSKANVASHLNNTDVLLAVQERVRPEDRPLLNQRAASSDPCESVFNLVRGKCGCKPAVREMQGAEATLAFKLALQRAPREVRGWSLRKRRTRFKYAARSQAHVSAGGVRKWNNGAKVLNAQLSAKREARVILTSTRKARKRHGSIRDKMHNHFGEVQAV